MVNESNDGSSGLGTNMNCSKMKSTLVVAGNSLTTHSLVSQPRCTARFELLHTARATRGSFPARWGIRNRQRQIDTVGNGRYSKFVRERNRGSIGVECRPVESHCEREPCERMMIVRWKQEEGISAQLVLTYISHHLWLTQSLSVNANPSLKDGLEGITSEVNRRMCTVQTVQARGR